MPVENAGSDRQRISDVLQPFLALEREIQARRRMPHYDLQSVLWLLSLFLAWIPYGFALSQRLPSADLWMKVAVGGSCVAGAFLIWSLATDVRRFKQKKAYPLLAKRLAPRTPSLQELKESLGICRQQGFMIGTIIQIGPLVEALKARGHSPP